MLQNVKSKNLQFKDNFKCKFQLCKSRLPNTNYFRLWSSQHPLQSQTYQFKTLRLHLKLHICKIKIYVRFHPLWISQFDQFNKAIKKRHSPTFQKDFQESDFSRTRFNENLKISRNCRNQEFQAILRAFKANSNNDKSAYSNPLLIWNNQ